MAALDRWDREGLLDRETVARLFRDLEERGRVERLRFTRVLLATVGAAIMLLAAASFFNLLWPALGPGERSLTAAAVASVLTVAGHWRERKARGRAEPWYLLQCGGLLLLAGAMLYSVEAWANGTLGGVLWGAVALLVPLVAVPFYARGSAVMPTLSLVLGQLFLLVFLVRTGISARIDAVWVLDAAFVAAAAWLLFALRRPGAPEWYLHALVASLYLAPLLLFVTVTGPLGEPTRAAVWPLDAWLVASTAIVLWATDHAPAHLRRDWYAGGVAVAVPIAVGLAFWTTLATLRAPPEVAALSVAAIGVLALLRGLPRGERELLAMGAIALVIAAWYYTVARARMWIGVVALSFTAVLLFQIALRIGRARGDAQTSK